MRPGETSRPSRMDLAPLGRQRPLDRSDAPSLDADVEQAVGAVGRACPPQDQVHCNLPLLKTKLFTPPCRTARAIIRPI